MQRRREEGGRKEGCVGVNSRSFDEDISLEILHHPRDARFAAFGFDEFRFYQDELFKNSKKLSIRRERRGVGKVKRREGRREGEMYLIGARRSLVVYRKLRRHAHFIG